MWPYCTNAYDIFRCPSDPSYVIVNGVARPRVRSISMNVYLGGFAGYLTAAGAGQPSFGSFLRRPI